MSGPVESSRVGAAHSSHSKFEVFGRGNHFAQANSFRQLGFQKLENRETNLPAADEQVRSNHNTEQSNDHNNVNITVDGWFTIQSQYSLYSDVRGRRH